MKEEPLRYSEITVSKRVLVVGNGVVSRTLIRELMGMGLSVIWTDSELIESRADNFESGGFVRNPGDKTALEILAPAEIAAFYGSPGRFHASFKQEQGDLEREVGAVILATEAELESPFEGWGLGPSGRVQALSALEAELKTGNRPFSGDDGEKFFVFVCGFTGPSNPFSQKTAIRAAMKLSMAQENRVLFLLEHFKVADLGLERLSREARESGVLFVKVSQRRPRVELRREKVTVSYEDEALGDEVTVNPDLVVLEEPYRPNKRTASLAKILGIHLDPNGFFQADEVYDLPIFTNRTGIWVAGPAKGCVSMEEGLEEARAAALEAFHLLGKGKQRVAENRMQLDRKRCTICLTCYRLCPHRAISYVNRRPVFYDLACRACGICAAECPMDAIQVHGFSDARLELSLCGPARASKGEGGGRILQLVVFACQNSAFEAARLASLSGAGLPQGLNLIKMPCAGRVDENYLLGAFRRGADAVMVLGCHQGSCKSGSGSRMAKWKVENIRDTMEEMGLDRERLQFGTVAPGMAFDLVRIIDKMETRLQALSFSPARPMNDVAG